MALELRSPRHVFVWDDDAGATLALRHELGVKSIILDAIDDRFYGDPIVSVSDVPILLDELQRIRGALVGRLAQQRRVRSKDAATASRILAEIASADVNVGRIDALIALSLDHISVCRVDPYLMKLSR